MVTRKQQRMYKTKSNNNYIAICAYSPWVSTEVDKRQSSRHEQKIYNIVANFKGGAGLCLQVDLDLLDQRRHDTVDLCAIIAKFNYIPMESRDANNGSE